MCLNYISEEMMPGISCESSAIHCGELIRRASNEYLKRIFLWRNQKNASTFWLKNALSWKTHTCKLNSKAEILSQITQKPSV